MSSTADAVSSDIAILQAQERQRAERAIASFSSRQDLVDFAKRLQEPRYGHLLDLVDTCYDRCIREGLLHGNYRSLPEPLPEDTERVDLHRSWLVAIVITNKCSLAVVNSVRGRGYLQAMLNQIDKLEDIGAAGFLRLKEDNALQHSAEYLMRKYYSDRLRQDQIEKIDMLLAENSMVI
jgi:hypothetical protein